MKLEQSFEVAAPLDRVWPALIDVQRVAPCLPGADISGRNEDGSYNGTFRVKIGPTAAAYAGTLQMETIDQATHTATMQAQGTDRRGQGGAKATIVSSVKDAGPGATLVEVSTDYHITGRLARFGRGGMIEEISNRLLREFATSLQEMLAAPAEEGAYETFVAMPAVPAVPAVPASEAVRSTASGEDKPKRRARRDLAAAADAVAAASQPAAAPPEPPVEAAAQEELAAVVPEASEESAPPAAEAPQPAPEPEVPEPAPPPEPEIPEPALPPEPEIPASPSAPEPPPVAEPPAVPEPPPAEAPPTVEAEPLDGLALARGVIVDRVKSNPAPLLVLVLALLLLSWRRRRRG